MTVSSLISEIQKYCPWFEANNRLKSNINCDVSDINTTILRYYDKIPCICKTYQSFLADNKLSLNKCNENLNRVVLEEGMTLESLGYFWIKNTSMGALMTPIVNTTNTLGGNAVDLDGEIENDFLFDIKSFSPFSRVIEHKLTRLRKEHPKYVFMISNRTDLSAKDIYDQSVSLQADKIEKNDLERGTLSLPNGGTILMIKRRKINISESSFSPFVWCENNYKIFLNHCHQFAKDKPFVLVEMMDSDTFFGDRIISTFMLLRTLVRRTFFEFYKSEELASTYDNKVNDKKLLVKNAIVYLSAILFIDCKTGKAFAFTNPHAIKTVSRHAFERYGWDNTITVDGFQFDNY